MLYLDDLDADTKSKVFEQLPGWEYMLKLTSKTMAAAWPKQTKTKLSALVCTLPSPSGATELAADIPDTAWLPAKQRIKHMIKWIRMHRNGAVNETTAETNVQQDAELLRALARYGDVRVVAIATGLPFATFDGHKTWTYPCSVAAAAAMEPNGMQIVNFLLADNYTRAGVARELVKRGDENLEILKAFYARFPEDAGFYEDDDEPNQCPLAAAAASSGSLRTLQWLMRSLNDTNEEVYVVARSYLMMSAILYDRRDVVYWLACVNGCQRAGSNDGYYWSNEDCNPYAYWWTNDNSGTYAHMADAVWNECCVAAYTGNLPLLKWLCHADALGNADFSPSPAVFWVALCEGHFHVARWIAESDFFADMALKHTDLSFWWENIWVNPATGEQDVDAWEVAKAELEHIKTSADITPVAIVDWVAKWKPESEVTPPPAFDPMPWPFLDHLRQEGETFSAAVIADFGGDPDVVAVGSPFAAQ